MQTAGRRRRRARRFVLDERRSRVRPAPFAVPLTVGRAIDASLLRLRDDRARSSASSRWRTSSACSTSPSPEPALRLGAATEAKPVIELPVRRGPRRRRWARRNRPGGVAGHLALRRRRAALTAAVYFVGRLRRGRHLRARRAHAARLGAGEPSAATTSPSDAVLRAFTTSFEEPESCDDDLLVMCRCWCPREPPGRWTARRRAMRCRSRARLGLAHALSRRRTRPSPGPP